MTNRTMDPKVEARRVIARKAATLRRRDAAADDAREALYAEWEDAHDGAGLSYRDIAEASGVHRAWVIAVIRRRRKATA